MISKFSLQIFETCFRTGLRFNIEWKKLDHLCTSKTEINIVCNVAESHCPQAMKLVHYHASGRFNWLISAHERFNPSRESISILSGKYKIFTFVRPALIIWMFSALLISIISMTFIA